MFTLPVHKFDGISKTQPEVYALIREETEWMIAYPRKIEYMSNTDV